MIVLIVEDEPIIAVNLALVLESVGHVVLGPVRSKHEAIALCEKCRPTVALMDINLEGRSDGIELARILKGKDIPSVFLSAQHAQALRNQDAALGFIGKPYSAANVCDCLDVVATLLAGQAPPKDTGVLEVFR